jgi:leucyl/phenylalanyl-tRNA---protein transferase
MTIILINDDIEFPDMFEADENDIVAIGGDFSLKRLLQAYRSGIFPWPHQGLPLLWFCPDPRFVLEPQKIKINQTLRKIIKKTSLHVRTDIDFLSVIKNCQIANRGHQNKTWITDSMINGYIKLHEHGFAHSIEAYEQGHLVGGLYGIGIGSIFFGESMFYKQDNASKICFITLIAHLLDWNFSLIDCQVYSKLFENFGALGISRNNFLQLIKKNQHIPEKTDSWSFYMSPQDALKRIFDDQLNL